MRRRFVLRWLTTVFAIAHPLVVFAAGHAAAGADQRRTPLLLAHYMTWFEAKPVSGGWGWHWTMNHYHPDDVSNDGRRPIASHYYPSIGPYDSSDPDVMEYHALLMKIAGLDGAIVDWYGDTDFLDYGLVHRNANRFVAVLKRFHLQAAICYEDQSVKHMVDAKFIRPDQVLDQGRKHLGWLAAHWFGEPNYVKWNGAPLLLVYGPQKFTPDEWTGLHSGLPERPACFSLDEKRPSAVGAFAWPPMWMSKGKTLLRSDLDGYLRRFGAQPDPKIPVAFPGFHDAYEDAGVSPSYGFLDAAGGAVFESTLDGAIGSGSPFVQLATWNDFGEGTNIEPTREYGYRYLETIQKSRKRLRGASFSYTAADLRLPIRIYHLRKQAPSKETRNALDGIAQSIASGRTAGEDRLLSRLEAR